MIKEERSSSEVTKLLSDIGVLAVQIEPSYIDFFLKDGATVRVTPESLLKLNFVHSIKMPQDIKKFKKLKNV